MVTPVAAGAGGARIDWQTCGFDGLTAADVYAVLALRQAVFVVEQQCIFPDIDWLDQPARHLLGWTMLEQRRTLVAYLRLLPPGLKYPECAIGRVVTSPLVRGTRIGRQLVARGVELAGRLYPAQPIRIGAQMQLERFYGSFGFETVSAPYNEDDIMHVEMLRSGSVA